MGLDWLAGARPVAGREEEGWSTLRSSLGSDDPEKLERWRAFPKVDSWNELGAPRVGFDAEADAWFLSRIREHQPGPTGPATAEERNWLAKNKGYYVLDLAPPCDGIPVYSHSALNKELERSSFRGQFLNDAVEVIGRENLERAKQNMLPPELLEYGRALGSLGARYATEHGVTAIAAQRMPPPDPEGTPASIAHIVSSAAKWCVFWAERGHWLNTWW